MIIDNRITDKEMHFCRIKGYQNGYKILDTKEFYQNDGVNLWMKFLDSRIDALHIIPEKFVNCENLII